MSYTKVCVLLLSVSALSVQAAFTLSGSCPDYKYTNALDIKKLAFDWYNIESAVNGLDLGLKTCEPAPVRATANDGFEVILIMADGNTTHMKADPVAGQVGKFESKEPGKPVVYVNWIDGDSDNYAAVITCAAHDNKHGHFAEVVSRKPTLEPQYLEKGRAALAAAGITDKMTMTDMTKCQ